MKEKKSGSERKIKEITLGQGSSSKTEKKK